MAGITSSLTDDHLIRANVWSEELKTVATDTMMAQTLVRLLPDFMGTTLNIPSIGNLPVRGYQEDTPVIYDALDTGNYTFTVNEYLHSGTYITDVAAQDTYYAAQLEAAFVPSQARAIQEYIESAIFAIVNNSARGGQTAASSNAINGTPHRWVASGGSDSARTLTVEDFSKARYALQKALMPTNNLIAIVSPETAQQLETLPNIVNMASNPRWEGVIVDGMLSDKRFIKNIYGFDVYVSNFLASTGAVETIDAGGGARAVSASNVTNIFFSAQKDTFNPFLFSWKQAPRVEAERNKDMQRHEYVTTARFGVQVFRPENLICILSDGSGTVSF